MIPIPPIIIWVLLGIVVAFMGRNRKFGFWGYLLCSVLLSPLIGILLVLASDRKPSGS